MNWGPGDRSDDEGRPVALVVDDDPLFVDSLARGLRRRGFSAYVATSVAEARRMTLAARFDAAVVDLLMSDGSALDVVPMLRREQPEIAIVVLTGHGSVAAAVETVKLGANNFLLKPVGVDQVIAGLNGAVSDEQRRVLDGEQLARVEWEHIHRVLAASGGNVSEAARRLGLPRRSLQRKLRKYPPRQ
jgi:two-component system response regulator RegA